MLARCIKTTRIIIRNNHRPRNNVHKSMVEVNNGKRSNQPSHNYNVLPTGKQKSGAHKSRTEAIFAQIHQSLAG